MKVITYTRFDGGLSIVIPALNAQRKNETDDEFIERIRNKDVPKDATSVHVIDAFKVPSDRTFRNAWKSDLTVDMLKAREIHRNHLRQMRAPLLQTLDVEYQIADEQEDITKKRRIALKKQALRDVTIDPAIEEAKTPEELKAVVPTVLKN
jgi:hypothetical protein